MPLEDDFSTGVLIGYYDFTDDGKASIGEASYGHAAVNVTKDAGSFGAFSVNLGTLISIQVTHLVRSIRTTEVLAGLD